MPPDADLPPRADLYRPGPTELAVFGGLEERRDLALLLRSHADRQARNQAGRPPEAGDLIALQREAARLPSGELWRIAAGGVRRLLQRPQMPGADRAHLQRLLESFSVEADLLGSVSRQTAHDLWRSRWRPMRRRRLAGRLRELHAHRESVLGCVEALQRRLAELARRQDRLRQWEVSHQGEILRAEACAVELHAREDAALDWLERHPPRYLIAALGRPEAGMDEEARAAWRGGVREIESYRREASITDPDQPLGEPPESAYLRYRYRVASVVVGQLGRRLGVEHPATGESSHQVSPVDEVGRSHPDTVVDSPEVE